MNVEPMQKRKRRRGAELEKHLKQRSVYYAATPVGECSSGKDCYISREVAQKAVERWGRKGVKLIAYRHGRSSGGCGSWHLTSSRARRG